MKGEKRSKNEVKCRIGRGFTEGRKNLKLSQDRKFGGRKKPGDGTLREGKRSAGEKVLVQQGSHSLETTSKGGRSVKKKGKVLEGKRTSKESNLEGRTVRGNDYSKISKKERGS